jgi:hypothetical protein
MFNHWCESRSSQWRSTVTSKRANNIEIIGKVIVEDVAKIGKSYVGGKLLIRYEKEEPCKKGDLLITGLDCHILCEIIEEV